jgi:hypothetical protein
LIVVVVVDFAALIRDDDRGSDADLEAAARVKGLERFLAQVEEGIAVFLRARLESERGPRRLVLAVTFAPLNSAPSPLCPPMPRPASVTSGKTRIAMASWPIFLAFGFGAYNEFNAACALRVISAAESAATGWKVTHHRIRPAVQGISSSQ